MNNYKRKTVLFLISQGISLFGSSIVQFAIIWFITKETSSGVLISLLTACSFIPQMLISFISGVWADRHSKKMLIILSDSIIAVSTLVLAILIPFISSSNTLIVALMITSVIRSLGTGVQQPAVGAFLPELVPQDALMKVNGINSALQSAVGFAAPAAAGAILTFSSMRNALFIDIATAIAGIGLLSFIVIPKSQKKQTENPSMLSDIKAGAKYTFSDKFLGKLLILFGGFIFLCVPAGFLATLFVTRTYGDTYKNMSIVEIIGFMGMMIGGLLIGTWGGFRNRMKTLLVGLFAFGVLAIGMGAVNNFVVYLILMAVYGIALTMVQTATTTMIQEKATPEMQGRVFGFLNIMYSGFLPIGMITFGPMADHISLNSIMIASGIILALAALIISFDKKYYEQGIPDKIQHK